MGRGGADLGLQVGQVGALGGNVLDKGKLQMPLYIRAAAELLGRDVVGGLYQSVKGDEAPRGLLREDVRDAGALEGFAGHDYVEPEVCSSSCSTRPASGRPSSPGA